MARRKNPKLIPIIGVVILLFIFAGGGYWYFVRPTGSDFQNLMEGFALPEFGTASDAVTQFIEDKIQVEQDKIKPEGNIVARLGLISDSHGYVEYIRQAIFEMSNESVDLVVHLGDFTAAGENQAFRDAKNVLDAGGIEYKVMPGDHDFNWYPEHSRTNYEQVFGDAYDRVVEYNDQLVLILFDNSTLSIEDDGKYQWLRQNLESLRDDSRVKLFLSPEPLFNPYFDEKSDESGNRIVEWLGEFGVRYGFAGNTHIFSQYDNEDHDFNIVTVGAIGEYKNPLPQWVLVEVYENGYVDAIPKPLVNL